ncbi:hypothetical protein K431DRAFT_285580 [Polychaeton citri CBS 116435]|uniref:NADH dehydrogenase [ubiquinone] 1 alpha subcomplex assembly factor 3 n=1 Tax=Polychaeton citri CBS 116435 TaxID=1314669 RepID=A0A9P4Q6Z7_9PEZI|nr:hypothetical protein K431DRAFT_285580 [Polychaeton citri CBS 116435]
MAVVPKLPQVARSRTLTSLASPVHAQQALSKRFKASTPAVCNNGSPSTVNKTARCIHSTSSLALPPAPRSTDRGPPSKEDTQTDFGAMDVLNNTPPPTTAVDMCMADGFALNSGLRVTGAGVMLVAGEVFKWRPWIKEGRKEGTIGAGATGDDIKGLASSGGKLQNPRGQWEVDRHAWGILDLMWPKPDLLILGTGAGILPVSPQTRQHINDLGVRLEVQDTRNAAAQFNLLATERGTQQVAAALVPIGWKEGR